MDDQVQKNLGLAIEIQGIAIILGVMLTLIFIGNVIKNNIAENINSNNAQISTSILNELHYSQQEMPTAAAYNLIQSHSSSINSSICEVCNKTITPIERINNEIIHHQVGSCLKNHMTGKVILYADIVSEGIYDIYIYPN
jgi:ACT domain-containing protein